MAKSSTPPTGGPATPQQDVEARPSTTSNNADAVKVLTASFEAVVTTADAACSDEGQLARKASVISDSSDDEIKHKVNWRPNEEPQPFEPILESNEERFCLLPVK